MCPILQETLYPLLKKPSQFVKLHSHIYIHVHNIYILIWGIKIIFALLCLKNKIWQYVDCKEKLKNKDENPNKVEICLSTPTHVLILHIQPPNSGTCFSIAYQLF